VRDYVKSDEKRAFLSITPVAKRAFKEITPDPKGNWINLSNNDFETLIPLANPRTKAAKSAAQEKTVFKLYSNGIVTARDEWIVDFDRSKLGQKVNHFCAVFSSEAARWNSVPHKKATPSELANEVREFVSREIKWTSELEAHLVRGTKLTYNDNTIRDSMYRPFVKAMFTLTKHRRVGRLAFKERKPCLI